MLAINRYPGSIPLLFLVVEVSLSNGVMEHSRYRDRG